MSAETEIKDALIRLHAGIKSADGGGISGALAQLDALLAAHRGALDPRLEHFLAGRSYAKALAWLGGDSGEARPAAPPGGCGGRT